MADERVNGPDGPSNPGKKGKKLLFAAVGLLLMLGAAGFYVWYFILGSESPRHQIQQAVGRTPEDSGVRREPSQIGPLFPLDSFVVNLFDKDGERYLKLTLELELSDAKLVEELGRRSPQLRDTIITLLSSKSFEEVSSLAGKQLLKSEIKLRVNRLLTSGQVKQVYYTEFVVQ